MVKMFQLRIPAHRMDPRFTPEKSQQRIPLLGQATQSLSSSTGTEDGPSSRRPIAKNLERTLRRRHEPTDDCAELTIMDPKVAQGLTAKGRNARSAKNSHHAGSLSLLVQRDHAFPNEDTTIESPFTCGNYRKCVFRPYIERFTVYCRKRNVTPFGFIYQALAELLHFGNFFRRMDLFHSSCGFFDEGIEGHQQQTSG